jgi:uncharacterized protein YciI
MGSVAMRTVFLVVREPGPRWLHAKPLRDQPGWEAHARFMDELFVEGRLLFGGPLPDVPGKVVLVLAAPSRESVFELLDADPWARDDVLRTTSVAAWEWSLDGAARAAA